MQIQENQIKSIKRNEVLLFNTKRLKLREIREEDTDFIVRLRSNYEVYRYFINPHQITIEEHLDWYRNCYLKNNDRFDWIAFDKTGKTIGVFSIKRIKRYSSTFEISYILDPDEYGKGYGQEAVRKVIEVGRNLLHCNCVIAEIHKDNDKSIKFIENLGFILNAKKGMFNIYKKTL